MVPVVLVQSLAFGLLAMVLILATRKQFDVIFIDDRHLHKAVDDARLLIYTNKCSLSLVRNKKHAARMQLSRSKSKKKARTATHLLQAASLTEKMGTAVTPPPLPADRRPCPCIQVLYVGRRPDPPPPAAARARRIQLVSVGCRPSSPAARSRAVAGAARRPARRWLENPAARSGAVVDDDEDGDKFEEEEDARSSSPGRSMGVRSCIPCWLLAINEAIYDAEEQAWKNPVVKSWIAKLKLVACDADDAIDELHYEALRREALRRGHNINTGVRAFSPHSNPLLFKYKIGKRLRHILDRISELVLQMNQFQFIQGRPMQMDESRQTYSYINEQYIIGRDKKRDEIVHMLLSAKSNELLVLPIVGIGGLGKTTLAQLVFNDI
uniref:Disease resistance N-terminal domain-containing protein n=1 Tax=Oryza glumipatula TaxID=40148 RepID=A0A0D9ZYH0_9ORYZ